MTGHDAALRFKRTINSHAISQGLLTKISQKRIESWLDELAEPDAEGGASVRLVPVFDPADLAGAMSDGAGEKMVMAHVRANLPTIRQLVNRGGRH